MVKYGNDFHVFDAKSGDDITRQVLTQIVFEQESKDWQSLLPINFLRHLISFYGNSLQSFVPKYLDHSMGSFARNQEQMRHYMHEALDGLMPFQQFEEMRRQNLSLFEGAMKMFNPDFKKNIASDTWETRSKKTCAEKRTDGSTKSYEDLVSKSDSMQLQIERLKDRG